MKHLPRSVAVFLCVLLAASCSKKKKASSDEEGAAARQGGADESDRRRLTLPAPKRFSAGRAGGMDADERADELSERMARRRERMARQSDPERRARREEIIGVYDKDGDGALNEEERAEMRSMRIDERITRLDTDGDGLISREEAEASADDGRGGLRGFERLDQDGDGQVSREEMINRPRRRRTGRRFRNWREEGP